MKKLIILGACGSIGRQTLELVEQNSDKFKVVGMSLGRDLELGKELVKKFKPEIVCTRHSKDVLELADIEDVKFCYGDLGLEQLACYKENDKDIKLVVALSGIAGLRPTIDAINIKRDILLANKETLVVAGEFVMRLAKQNNVHIYPIDSEHSAIWQSIQGEKYEDINKLIITASGGAFRDVEDLSRVSVADALAHPNWNMGKKITIDCATMANKAFEVMEAHHLFGVPYDKIDVLLHRESIIHSLVMFKDSSVKAQLGNPDMKMPIAYALNYPEGRLNYQNELDLTKHNLSFGKIDQNKYPLFYLGLEVAKKGNIYPCVLNAANEVAVNLFLEGKIAFLDIYKIIEEQVNNTKPIEVLSLDKIFAVDLEIRKNILSRFEGDQK